MINVKNDLTGKRFGALTVLYQVEDYVKGNGRKLAMWKCKCDCGNFKNIIGEQMVSGRTTSCGCGIYKKQKLRQQNDYDLNNSYGICFAHNTGSEIYFDLEDYDKIKKYCWYEDKNTGYAKTRISEHQYIFMHRLITNDKYQIVDHINRQKLDNRKENLRNATRQENILNRDGTISTNTSGYTGVSFNNKLQKWCATIHVNNKKIYLGVYTDKDDAILARLKAEKEYYGEFAPQRHLFEEYGI